MLNESCILTAKEFSILKAMHDRCLGIDAPTRSLLLRKIRSSTVVFSSEVPDSVATVNSRVQYRIDDREPEMRVISQLPAHAPIGMSLSIASKYGLALLGLGEGQEMVLRDSAGAEETIRLEKVLYQPESARRERQNMATQETPAVRRAMLRVIDGAYSDRPPTGFCAAPLSGSDDPGPSAA